MTMPDNKTPKDRKAYLREWRRRNPERVYQLNERHKPPSIKDMSEAERESVRERARAYYQKNKERIVAYQKQYKVNLKMRRQNAKKLVESSIASRFDKSS